MLFDKINPQELCTGLSDEKDKEYNRSVVAPHDAFDYTPMKTVPLSPYSLFTPFEKA